VVHYLRLYNRLPASAAVGVGPAEVQLQRGSAAQDTQAAHNMPCNIKLDGRNVWEWIPESLPTASLLRKTVAGWFGSTVVLPSAVNKCDSLWEARGLKDALANALRQIVPRHVQPAGAAADLTAAFELFRQGSRTALADAQAHNRAKLAAERDPAEQHALAAMGAILNIYAEELPQFSPAPTIAAHLAPGMAQQWAEALGKAK
jgi:hypothetical protein